MGAKLTRHTSRYQEQKGLLMALVVSFESNALCSFCWLSFVELLPARPSSVEVLPAQKLRRTLT